MNSNSVITLILLVFVVAQRSDASLLSKFRKLVAIAPGVNVTQISPSPAPISGTKSNHTEKPQESQVPNNSSESTHTEKPQESQTPNNSSKLNHTEKPQEPQVPNSSSKPKPQESHVPKNPSKPQNDSHTEKDSNPEVINEKCEPLGNRCIQKMMIACLKQLDKGSQDFTILIQNEGESVLKVTVVVPVSVEVSTPELDIPQHQAKKINASTRNVGESQKIVLKAVYGDCVLYTGVPINEENFFQRIPWYANNLTPIHAAYFIFVVALIVGGTWSWCKLGKKGQEGEHGGVPYQELEMAAAESGDVVGSENGWDEGWDDDWDDEEKAVKRGAGAGNRNRDGWENDWDE